MTNKKTRVRDANVPEPADGLWSNCIRVGDILYLSGMTSRGEGGAIDDVTISGNDEYNQAKIIFGKIKKLVEAAGGTMNDIVRLTTYMTDISKRDQVIRARKECFVGDYPASTLIGVVALARQEMLVEIEATAHIGSGS